MDTQLRPADRPDRATRPIPFTRERAATELTRARSQLADALGSLELALVILRTLPDVGERWQLVAAEGVLARLEEARLALDRAGI
ncbi:MAG TPA: hypothetical protein VIC58_11330 [Actinomycetota bacterium]|jgi:hypothetical protein